MTNRLRLSTIAVRRCGLAPVVLALVSLPFAPLNALARMQTASGRSDLENELAAWWAEPAMQNLAPWLLDFADADTVYLTYGKFYLLAVLAVLAAAVATRSRRPARLSSVERWGWRLTIGSLGLMSLGQLGAYWFAFVDEGYVVILLAMLVGAFGNILLGAGLVRSGFRPRTAAWVILLDLPLSIALVAVSTQALGIWPMMLAWGLIGWTLWRSESEPPSGTTMREVGTAPASGEDAGAVPLPGPGLGDPQKARYR